MQWFTSAWRAGSRFVMKTHKSSKPADPEWPPHHWKFTFETADEPKCEAAFVDYRRFGRIRLLNCAGDDIRRESPLKENGPDPFLDRHVVTEAWLAEKLAKRKVPVKALLLNQAVISGIGNWVGWVKPPLLTGYLRVWNKNHIPT